MCLCVTMPILYYYAVIIFFSQGQYLVSCRVIAFPHVTKPAVQVATVSISDYGTSGSSEGSAGGGDVKC